MADNNDKKLTAGKKLTEDEMKEWAGYMLEAVERHVTHAGVIEPGFMAQVLNESVHVPTRDIDVPQSVYFTMAPTEGMGPNEPLPAEMLWLWAMRFDGEDEDGDLRGELAPLIAGDGKPLLYEELATWLAIADARREGDTAKADRIFTLAYRQESGEAFKGDAGKTPMLLRTGKAFTEAMRATDKRGKFEHESGGELVMAGDLMITAKRGELAVSTGINKTLAYLNHLATMGGYGYRPGRNCVVTTSVDEILQARNLEPTRKNKERVRNDVKALSLWAWEWENKKTHEWQRVPLAGGVVRIKRGGVIEFTLSADFMAAVLNNRAGLMPTDPLLLGTDDKRHPHAFAIGWKLATHSYQNAGEANQNTLSVTKLLEYVDTLPNKDEVASRHHTRRIIEPMERDLDHLVEIGVLKWWGYSHEKGRELTPEEYAAQLDEDGNEKALPYEIAITANIQWQFENEYVEHMAKTMAARERNRAAALERRNSEAKRQQRIERKKESYVAKKLADEELRDRKADGR